MFVLRGIRNSPNWERGGKFACKTLSPLVGDSANYHCKTARAPNNISSYIGKGLLPVITFNIS